VWPALAALCLPALVGCNSVLNGWLDPTVLGKFNENKTLEIRSSLTIEDAPPGIAGASYPTREDLEYRVYEYPISPGDSLAVEIFELLQRGATYGPAGVRINEDGTVNLPVVGRVRAQGLTVPEFEAELGAELRRRDILIDPMVTVNPVSIYASTYSIFGIGASAATQAPLRAGTFPIQRPGLRLLEAINQVGGLNEFVTDLYIFRYDDTFPGATIDGSPPVARQMNHVEVPGVEDQPPAATEPSVLPEEAEAPADSPRDELMEAVTGPDEDMVVAQAPPADDVAAEMTSEPPQPFIYLNGEWVPNPAIDEPAAPRPDLERVSEYKAGSPVTEWDHISGDAQYRIVRVPAEALRSGDPEVNVYVRPGDVIRIVSGEIGLFWMMGQVNRVGAAAFNSEPITLKSAIASAGGLSGLAWPDRCTVYRRLGQREQMIQVNLDSIFAGKEPDFYIRRGDIINVGTHPLAPFLLRLRILTTPNPTSNVGYSFTYARNFADIDSFGARINPNNQPDRFPGLFP
jgi:protein involved in polysaccharide export with SLBB domain